MHDQRNFVAALIGDGRPLLSFTGLCLVLAGLFALFLSATGHFLPHDVQYLALTPEELCSVNQCRIVHFMLHDRVSFGGAIIAVGTLYLWLAEFPLKQQKVWAWWLFALSGALGFGNFLAYLGYGYLDAWHGVATLALLPCFGLGLARTVWTLPAASGPHCLLQSAASQDWSGQYRRGRRFMLAAAAGLIAGGLIIMTVGMTIVFVPQDVAFLGISAAELQAINPRLVPLIAHDRAGFGGGVATCGVMMFSSVWCGEPSRSLWQALAIAGTAGFVTAIGVHPLIGYNDPVHLAPAILGAVLFTSGLVLMRPQMHSGTN